MFRIRMVECVPFMVPTIRNQNAVSLDHFLYNGKKTFTRKTTQARCNLFSIKNSKKIAVSLDHFIYTKKIFLYKTTQASRDFLRSEFERLTVRNRNIRLPNFKTFCIRMAFGFLSLVFEPRLYFTSPYSVYKPRLSSQLPQNRFFLIVDFYLSIIQIPSVHL